jgi:hypothetical protein
VETIDRKRREERIVHCQLKRPLTHSEHQDFWNMPKSVPKSKESGAYNHQEVSIIKKIEVRDQKTQENRNSATGDLSLGHQG